MLGFVKTGLPFRAYSNGAFSISLNCVLIRFKYFSPFGLLIKINDVPFLSSYLGLKRCIPQKSPIVKSAWRGSFAKGHSPHDFLNDKFLKKA